MNVNVFYPTIWQYFSIILTFLRSLDLLTSVRKLILVCICGEALKELNFQPQKGAFDECGWKIMRLFVPAVYI